MSINVSVSDQVQDGYLAAGRGIADGIRAFAERRTNALGEMARSPDPAIASLAQERLKRTAGISPREERDFLTQKMEGLAQAGVVTMQDLDRFHGANLQGQREIFAQAATAHDLGLAATRDEQDYQRRLEFEQKRGEQDLQFTEAKYRANEASQGRISDEAIKRRQMEQDKALRADRYALGFLVEDFSKQAREEGWKLSPFDQQQAKRMTPEDAQRFLIQRREEALRSKQTGPGVPVVTQIPGVGAIVRDPMTGERVPSSQIIRQPAVEDPHAASSAMSGNPAAPSAPPPTATRSLIFGNGNAGGGW
jgi:hypothetical protein